MSQRIPSSSADSSDRAQVRVFPPLVPVGAILLGVLLERVWPLGEWVRVPFGLWIGGAIVFIAIFVLGAWAIVTFRRSGEDEKPWKPTHSLVVHGPYRFTRNPMYLQMVLVCLGCAVLMGNGWILFLTPACAGVLHYGVIRPEEVYLERKFGGRYVEYTRQVRRWI